MYKNTVKSGAAKGWEEKKQLWKEKDYQYELGVSVGASIGWAIQRLAGQVVSEELMDATIKYWFKKGLEMKSDPEILEWFDVYYSAKHTPVAEKKEKVPEIDINKNPF